VASTGKEGLPRRQSVEGVTVALTGAVESICTQVSTHGVQPPPRVSCARCVKRCLPSPMIEAVPLGAATAVTDPQLTFHS
jgi:hypothetical protein